MRNATNRNNLLVPEVDVFDIASGQWSTLPNNLPTPRAGGMVAAGPNSTANICLPAKINSALMPSAGTAHSTAATAAAM